MKEKTPTTGFGVPDSVDPHHFVLTIPRGRDEPVLIVEHFGLRAGHAGLPDTVDRAELGREKWSAIADALRRVFNDRLKEKGHAPSRWSVGDNKVERVLGKELCVLAWAVELASLDLIPVAVANWTGLKPEERWWLYTVTAAATGGVDDGNVGWRKALRFALTENPVRGDVPAMASARRSPRTKSGQLPLLAMMKERS